MSSSSVEILDEIEAARLLCHCQAMVKFRESGRPSNPARRFVNCAKSLVSDDACRFFRWVDPPLNKHYRDTLNKLKREVDGTETHRLKEEVENLKVALEVEKEMRATEKVAAAVKIAGYEGQVCRLKVCLKMIIVGAVVVVMGLLIRGW